MSLALFEQQAVFSVLLLCFLRYTCNMQWNVTVNHSWFNMVYLLVIVLPDLALWFPICHSVSGSVILFSDLALRLLKFHCVFWFLVAFPYLLISLAFLDFHSLFHTRCMCTKRTLCIPVVRGPKSRWGKSSSFLCSYVLFWLYTRGFY